MSGNKTTPLISQYLEIKSKHLDSILFFRMGDFYEMFFEDAKIASRELGITLTSRNKNDEDSVPLCGFPHKAADTYVAKLIERGYKVAICEQIEDPATAKGIVKRGVIRIVTPGMVFDENLLDKKSNNYILALHQNKSITGIAYLDISTGTFRLTESDNKIQLLDEIKNISPNELIVSESFKDDKEFKSILNSFKDKLISFTDHRFFEYKSARASLLNQLKTRSLEGYGCEDKNVSVSAAGAILSYIQDTQLQEVKHLSRIEYYSLDKHLILDDTSCRNLELINNIRNNGKSGTLIEVIDKTITSMGARLLKKWIRYPLLNKNDIKYRLDAIQESKESIYIRQKIRSGLKKIYDLERLGSKISMGHANARDLVALKKSLMELPELFKNLRNLKAEFFQKNYNQDGLKKITALIEQSIREDAPPTLSDGGIIKEGFHDELDEILTISRDGKKWIAEIGSTEKEKTGLSSLKIKFNKVFGYFIEVSKAQSEQVPESYVRKQTLVNCERYITDELKEIESKVLNAEERRNKLELEIFNQVRELIIQKSSDILDVAGIIADIDCILNLAEIADLNNYCRPEINSEGIIDITDGRHPVIEKMITGERYIPNSIKLDNEKNQILLITGPNMAGKSTILRQVAIISLLTQIGSFIPATKGSMCLIDRIFTRVGALDNLSQGQSTFMVEMEETANIINNATSKSLIIMDEIGRGTSTFDGLSIAWSVAEYLHDLNDTGVKTLFATHYHELTKLSELKTRVKNYNIAVKEWNDNIIFLRKIVKGSTNRSYGIQVARLAGLPDTIINRSKILLSEIENKEENQVNFSKKAIKKEKSSYKQLNLFNSSENDIINELLKIDISNTTPMEALNHINTLKNKIKDM